MLQTTSFNNPGPRSEARQVMTTPVLSEPLIPFTQESLREIAWAVGEKKPLDSFMPTDAHAALAFVNPKQGFVHWRLKHDWIEKVSREKGGAWDKCRMVVRVYDVTNIIFNGLNAHKQFDMPIGALTGHMLFNVARGGTSQIAEVGFVLRNGEFIAGARSAAIQFPPEGVSSRADHTALLVDDELRVETVANLWEQEAFLTERRKPKLRRGLRVAIFAFDAEAVGHKGTVATFVSQLAKEVHAQGHSVHVFLPRSENFKEALESGGAMYHPLDVVFSESPVETANSFARAAESRLKDFPDFDLYHCSEWMAAQAPWLGTRPTILSLTSTEGLRLGTAQSTALSLEIQKAERDAALTIDCILTPDWLRDRAVNELQVNERRVHIFPMEGRLPNQWEAPLDIGKVKSEIGFGPMDRLVSFIGPLEHPAGVDILVEAMATAIGRHHNLRLAIIGLGQMGGHLQHRINGARVGHAVHLLGHMEGPPLVKVLRSSEALILPARHRFHHDENIIGLARKAGKAVVTTHGGPAHLVQHEKTGVVTYDNPGSMVWALDRIMGDGRNTERMGQEGKRSEGDTHSWQEVARRYLALCSETFTELTEKTT
jgi:glycosyltransferase involved in cell wall biosynthesis